jgi:hypothetical protein
MKRQRGRNRGGNAGGGGGGGGKPQQNINRAFDSNGPDGVKIRGNAQHVFEKYQQLARDATSSGDRVLAEGYMQHAEHYFRVLRAFQPQRPPSDFLTRDSFGSGLDIDFEDDGANNFSDGEPSGEGESQPSAEGEGFDTRAEQPYRNDQQNRDQQRDWGRERQERREQQQQRARDDRPRDERPRDERPRDDRPRDDRPRDEQRPREDRPRDRPRNENRFERTERAPREERDPMPVVEPEAAPPLGEGGHQLRSQDGALSPAPAFLQARPERAPEAVAEDGEARRPRRRRAPRSFEGEAGPAPAETEEV